MPISFTQPAHLGALAILLGVAAPAIEQAHVLELGCAAGGNIIPLAARFPRATFTGIDLSAGHVDDGRRRIATLGLDNVTLRQGDLAQVRFARERFDYIVCHGVFSWVPLAVQDAILRICRDTLAGNGVAAISYNVYPGWHLRMVVRDLCLTHTDDGAPPLRRVAQARAALDRIARAAPAKGAYGLLLRQEAAGMRHMPSAYILGEFLATENLPCHVMEFIRRAAGHGLAYLCEADLATSGLAALIPGADRLAHERNIDFVTGRTFRCSVLARAERGPAAPDQLQRLHLSCSAALAVDDAVIRTALARLAAAYPATLTVADLTEAPGAEGQLCRGLLELVLAGRVGVSNSSLRTGLATQMRPRVWGVARAEARTNQPWLTTLSHTAVPSTKTLKELVPHLNGTKDLEALRLVLAEPGLGQALRYLARHGLLEPETTLDAHPATVILDS